MKNLILIIFVFVSLFWACKNPTIPGPGEIDPALKITKDLVIPNGFSFETTKSVSIAILVKNSSTNLKGIPVSIYLNYPGISELPNINAKSVGTFISDSNGKIEVKLNLPATQDSLYLKTKYIGLESEAGFAIKGLTASYNYGEGNTLKSAPVIFQTKAAFPFTFMGTFTSGGVPNYLEPSRDKITQGLLDSINASLPEYIHLPVSHPQYLKTGNEANIILSELADVWITFVGEGAGYTNSIGYYTYNSATPPLSIKDISKFTIIFPNASLGGSGGSMTSGDKVKLGRFPSGTGIGWFIVANGWNGTGVVNPPTYFSDPELNPETLLANRQHTVLLYNNLRGLLLLGFEDQIRNTATSSDEDFNDALFYITANPVKAVDVINVPTIDAPGDIDKDGVTNTFDEFPNDPLRAYTNYYPSALDYTSLLVEDLWPSFGDFDFNDLVVDCQYENVTNAASNIVDMYIKVKVRAIGAGFNNGFGIELPVAPSVVSSVTLTDQSGVVKNIGVEAGQSKAVVIAFDDAYTVLPSMGGGTGVNVIPGNGYRTPADIVLHITFTTPQAPATLSNAPFNPFVFVNGDRTKEIHLGNFKPTSKASSAFFGQADDYSNPATSTYYKSKNNLVWMLEVPSSFAYNIETKDILKAYLKFGAWAESGGTLFKDWYKDTAGYRDNSLLYVK
jgi:LruC domain-containing protein